jgi:phosphatidylglycerol:prolipoprotein diacylglycerol transferase
MFQAFEIGPFLIWSKLLFLCIAVWLSTEFFLRLAESAHLSLQHFRDRGLWYVASFLLAGRLLGMLGEYKIYVHDPLRVFAVHDGVFSFLGGAIGVGIALYVVTRETRSIFLQWLDALLPATCLGFSIDSIGAFLAGEKYGSPTNVFWGITYDSQNVRYTIPVHPVQLYYAAAFLILTFVLLVVRKRSRRIGAETLAGIVAACTTIFFLEFFRGDFSIQPVFAILPDFLVYGLLFLSLGIFAAIELRLSTAAAFAYQILLVALTGGYMVLRPLLQFATYELRLSQLLAVLALLITVVYVVVERRRHPHF